MNWIVHRSGRTVGQHARECAEGFRIDAGEGRNFQHEPVAGGIDVQFRSLVPRPPRQQLVQRLRARRRRPGRHRVRPVEQIQEPADHGFTLQPAGSITTRTQLASW